MGKMSLLKEIWLYLRQIPIIFVLVLMSVMLILAQTSALAPFIYSIF
jgi:hypothetical protein